MKKGITMEIDKFLNRIFYFSKIFSAAMVALCCVILLGLIFKLIFTGGGSVEVPKFKELKSSLEASSEDKTNYTLLDERREIEKRYGDQISKIVKKFRFAPQVYDIFIEDLTSLPPDYRDTFVEGLKDYLEDTRKYIEKKGQKTKISLAQAADIYRNLFRQRIKEAEVRKAQASLQRKYLLVALVGTLMVMLAFLVIPLLIRIEENTRMKSN